jgi:predicted ATPase
MTDVEGSTRLWAADSGAMSVSLRLHDVLVRGCIERHGGYVFATGGDGFVAAFQRTSDALDAAHAAQDALAAADWSAGPRLRVRMGIHVGEADERGGDYFGPVVNLTARVTEAGHGGQTLVTAVALAASGRGRDGMVDLGEHSVRDHPDPLHLFQLGDGTFPALRTSSVGVGSLPWPRTSLIGREADVGRIRRLLVSHRLVTLTGVGGCGKTRLAIEVSQREAPSHPQGVWFVDLAVVADDSAVPGGFAAALELRSDLRSSLVTQIATYLAPREAILVVDNCEHVINEVAQIIDVLLGAAPRLRVLATSREALELDGERSWRVPSLETGPDSAAVQLFIERASAATGEDLDPDSAILDAIAEIGQRLDGLPLAIELAAARTRTMSVPHIRDNLDDRFRLLSGGRRRSRQRQQTLEAAVQWSYDLLTADEQTLLRNLAVFQGGFDLTDVAAVVELPATRVLELLDALVAKSLVNVRRDRDQQLRYQLLETIRLFALARLLDAGEVVATRDRHLEHFLAYPPVRDYGQWLRLEGGQLILRELDNLRAAISWAIEEHRLDAAATLAAAVSDFLEFRGESTQVLAWLHQATDLSPEDDVRRLTFAAHVHIQALQLTAARESASAAIEIAAGRPLDHLPMALFCEGRAHAWAGRYDHFRDRCHEAVAVAREVPSADVVVPTMRAYLATSQFLDGDYAGAVHSLETALRAPDLRYRNGWEALLDLGHFYLGEAPPEHRSPDAFSSSRNFHPIVAALFASRSRGPEIAARELAAQALESVALQPLWAGDWLTAFAYFATERGETQRAEQLIQNSRSITLASLAHIVRTRLGLTIPGADDLEREEWLAHVATTQPALLADEVSRCMGLGVFGMMGQG